MYTSEYHTNICLNPIILPEGQIVTLGKGMSCFAIVLEISSKGLVFQPWKLTLSCHAAATSSVTSTHTQISFRKPSAFIIYVICCSRPIL